MLKERAESALAVKKSSKEPVNSTVLTGEPYKLEEISQLGMDALKILAKKFSPANIFPKLATLEAGDEPRAIDILGAADFEMELANALSMTIPFLEEGGSEILKAAGVMFPPRSAYGERLALAYLNQPGEFHEAFTRKLSSDRFRGRPYLFFKIAEGVLIPDGDISKAQEMHATQMCTAHFNSQDCGPTFKVNRYQNGNRIGFRIWHGSPFRNISGIDHTEKHKSARWRKEHTDVIFIDRAMRVCWIDATKEHVPFYLTLLGKVLLHNIEGIKDPVGLDLQFAIASDIEEKIQRAGGPTVDRTRMSLRVITGLKTGTAVQKAPRSRCVTQDYPLDVEVMLGQVTEVKISVELLTDSGPRPRGTIGIKGNFVTFPKSIPDEIVCKVLVDLGALPSYEN